MSATKHKRASSDYFSLIELQLAGTCLVSDRKCQLSIKHKVSDNRRPWANPNPVSHYLNSFCLCCQWLKRSLGTRRCSPNVKNIQKKVNSEIICLVAVRNRRRKSYLNLPALTCTELHLPKFTWIYLNLPKCTWIDQNFPEFSWIYFNLPEYTGVYQNLPDFTWIYLNLPVLTWIYLNSPGGFGILNHIPRHIQDKQ